MRIIRPLRLTAAAALSAVVATLAFAGPLAGVASAVPGKPQPTPMPTLQQYPANPTSSTTATFAWSAPVAEQFSCTVDGRTTNGCLSPVTFTGLTSATHTFSLRAKLAPPAKSKASTVTYSWVVDTTPPQAPTVQQVVSPTKNTTATVFFTDGDPSAVSFTCAVDNASPAAATPCSTSFTTPTLAEGSHTAYVYAFDALGNRSVAGTTTWTVDLTAPGSPVFSQVPANPTASTSATFAWSDGDATSFQCSLDGAAPASCSSGDTFGSLAEGSHTIVVQGRDTAGNVGLPATYAWQIDLTAPPAPTFVTGPASPTDQPGATFDFTDAENGVTFECSRDSAAFASCTSPLTFPSLLDGAHELDVRAVDAVGNKSAATAYQWSIDTSGAIALSPVIFLTGPDAFSKDSAPAFTWASLDSTATAFQCSLDLAPFTACGAPDTNGNGGTTLSVSSQGLHTLAVRETDGTNTSSAATWQWRYDSVAPTAPVFGTTPAATDPSSTAVFSFASDADTHFTCSLDGATATLCASPMSYPGLADGSHTFVVTAIDPAGNTSQSEYDWTIDTTALVAPSVNGPTGFVQVDTANVTWIETDPSITSESCKLDGATFTPCGTPAALTGLSDGTHTFAVTGSDGTRTATGSATWTVDTTKPVLNVSGVPSGVDSSATVTLGISQGTEAHPGADVCSLTGPNGTVNNCGPYTVTDGAYTLTVNTTDLAGNAADQVTLSWTVDRTAPTLNATGLPGSGAVVNDASESPNVIQTDANPGSPTCTLNGAPTSCSSVSTPTDGDYTFVANVSDQAGNAATPYTRTWTVDRTAPSLSVAIAGVTDGSVVNQTGGYTVTIGQGGEAHPGPVTCTLNGTTSPCDDLGTLSDGDYTFTASTSDTAGNTATPVSVNWTVDTVGPAQPVLSSTSVADGGVTKSREPQLSATDTDPVGSYQCSITGGVSCSVDQSTGDVLLSDNLADGSYSVTVTAYDEVFNPSPVASYTFDVDNAAPALSLDTLPNDGALVNDGSESPTVSSTDAHPGTLACTLNGTSSSCSSIATTDDGSYTFTATATDAVGNPASMSRTWTVDRTAPALNVSGLPAAGALVNQSTESISINQGSEPHQGAVTCALNGAPSSCSSLTGLTNGNYTFTADTTDLAGNAAPIFSRTWSVDVLAPTAAIVAPTTLTGHGSVEFSEPVSGLDASKVTLTETDSGVVIPTRVACDAVCTGTVSTLTVTPTRRLVPGQHYTLSVGAGAAQDAATNSSVNVTRQFRAQRVLQESTAPVAPAWQKVRSLHALGHSYVREHLAGAQATWTFRGRSFTLWRVTGPTQGKAIVLVDGKKKATVNSYATATHYQVARAFTRLGNRKHTVTIRVLGVKGAKAGNGTFVSIDGFTVGKKRIATPRLGVTWHRLYGKRFYGGHAVTSDLAGETISLTFRGKSVSWTTIRARTQGKARVYVDGVYKGTFDNYSALARYHVVRTLKGLSDKVHTLRIVVLGKHRNGGRGNSITVDRFNVG